MALMCRWAGFSSRFLVPCCLFRSCPLIIPQPSEASKHKQGISLFKALLLGLLGYCFWEPTAAWAGSHTGDLSELVTQSRLEEPQVLLPLPDVAALQGIPALP